MSTTDFQKGKFRPYHAITRIHLGAIEDSLEKGDVVEYDGQVMRWNGKEYTIATLRGAIQVGWLVPEGQKSAGYVPKPAGVQIHDAESMGDDRGEGRMMGAALDEEKDLGNREDIRGGRVSEGAPTGARVLTSKEEKDIGSTTGVTESGQEGRIVGRFKSATKNGPIEVGKDDRRVVSSLDNKSTVEVERVAQATGDVQETMVGVELEDVLPEATHASRPAPGVAGEGTTETGEDRARRLATERKARLARSDEQNNVTVTQTGSSVGGVEDGVVVGSIKKAESEQPASDVVDNVPPEAILQAKIEIIRQFVPGFSWDMSDHWRTRVKKALDHKDSMPTLNAILSLETDAVKKHVMKALYE